MLIFDSYLSLSTEVCNEFNLFFFSSLRMCLRKPSTDIFGSGHRKVPVHHRNTVGKDHLSRTENNYRNNSLLADLEGEGLLYSGTTTHPPRNLSYT
jgi:hypothetical protein